MARRTKAEAQATRNALIDAAERLFDSQGVSRTSLQDIAQAAGATRGAIYWHFKDKADLFNAMMERATAHLDDMAQQTPDAEAAPDMQGYVDGMVQVLGRIAEDEALSRVLRIATYRIEYVEELGAVQARPRPCPAPMQPCWSAPLPPVPTRRRCRRTWRRWGCRC